MKIKFLICFIVLVSSCSEQKMEQNEKEKKGAPVQDPITLTLAQAGELVELPLACIDTEYPNKLNQVIASSADLKSPEALHPAFYGCFDWHSAVHGHWSLVRMAKVFPELEAHQEIVEGLQSHLTAAHIEGELEYFKHPMSQGFERMYGWAWLLKLAEELHTWDLPEARQLEANLQPLTNLIAGKVKEFLPKLQYPIRVGTHTNTAFALCMVYDYAKTVDDAELLEIVRSKSVDYYQNDANCPLSWEPSGYDFLSPCLEEADLMRRVLPKNEFKKWLKKFLPNLSNLDFALAPGIVTDREDGHLVHLDGLNYSRAWCLFGIAETLPEYAHLNRVANEHIQHSLPDLTDGNYEGGHWLASFALMALTH